MTIAAFPDRTPHRCEAGCRHDPMPVACEGCGRTEGVALTRLAGGGSYAICPVCWERGRKGWFAQRSGRHV